MNPVTPRFAVSRFAAFRAGFLFFATVCLLRAVEPVEWVGHWSKFTAPPTRGFFAIMAPATPRLDGVLQKLPEASRWGELVDALAAAEANEVSDHGRQRMRLGRWLVMEMSGRGDAVGVELAAAVAAEEMDADTARRLLAELGRVATASSEVQVQAFEAQIAEHAGRARHFGNHDYVPGLAAPDLVTLAGEERAEALLRSAMMVRVALQIEQAAEPTRRLAARLAAELAPELAAPQWALAQNLGATELYEALRDRFGTPEKNDYQHDNARRFYIVGLILAGRADDALAEAEAAGEKFALPYGLADKLGRGGHEAAVHAFLHRLLERRPEAGSDLWSSYRRLSVQLGEQAGMLALIRAQASNDTLTGVARLRAAQRLGMAELATDDVVEGVKRLRAILVEARALDGEETFAAENAQAVLRVALALGDEAAENEAAGAVRDFTIAGLKKKREAYEYSSAINSALDVLAEAGARAEILAVAEAFEVKVAELRAAAAAAGASAGAGATYIYVPRDILAGVEEARLRLAVGGENWPEAERLLAEGEGWGAADAAGLIRNRYADKNEEPIGVLIARVLRARGDAEGAEGAGGARKALETQIVKTSGSDAAFAEYVDLLGEEAVPLLDKLYSLDRYEERPLIWKAVLASRAGDWAESERLARAAIAVDPSDGEQGRGDRMRVYAVLGEARAAQGDAKEAEFFARVVKAIRLSEQADKWHAAGLFTRSVAGYREALGLFADAYCVQSRLAIRLAEEGRMEEAMEHYQKAYELMPDSFGRVESHCFGCESAFAGKEQQGVAERVFMRLAEADPSKPQVHYLLGYLREEQQRLGEAAELYARAAELDPLYLNAWKKLGGLAGRMAMPVERRDEITLRLIELDPLGRHGSGDFRRVADGAGLWAALTDAKAKAAVLPRHASVLPLPASAAVLRADRHGASERDERDRRDPALVFAGRDFARQVDYAVMSLRHRR